MAFIGIVTLKKDEIVLKKAIIQNFKRANIRKNIIIINENNIDSLKNVKFDTIIMHNLSSELLRKEEQLKNIIVQTNFLLLNSDMKQNLDLIYKLKLTVITYGLNLKATVTASSIEKDKVCICIQRAIKNEKGNIIEPKEINIESEGKDVYKNIINYILNILYE